jgi:metal-dependent amidase/aminoacylase/carboxypeptidase family protein
VLSGIVSAIYALDVPQKEGTRTTYNVGTIEGGTSVNTIDQSARMLCEYRSDDRECLAVMERAFAHIFETAGSEDAEIRVRRVGERPCGAVDDAAIDALKAAVLPVIEAVTGESAVCRSASTDCNIPLSLGVPALCVGITRHSGVHTRQETLDKRYLDAGLEIALRLAATL